MILTAVMAHPRMLIRKAAVATLIAANTAAGARVSATRVEPHKSTLLPAISVYTLGEQIKIDEELYEPRELTRALKLEITGWVAHRDSYPADDAMDDLAAQVEAAMDANRYLERPLAITAVNPTTDQLTIPAHGLSTGDGPAELPAGAAVIPVGLSPGLLYYAIADDADHVRLATSLKGALAGAAVDITGAGMLPLQLFVSSVAESILESTDMQIVEDDGRSEPLVGIITMTYAVTYRTAPAIVGGNITDFLTADITHRLAGGVSDTVPGEDIVTVRSP